MEDNRDIYAKEATYDRELQAFIDGSSPNKSIILEYLRDCELGKVAKRGAKKKLDFSTLSKHLRHMDRMSRLLERTLVTLTQEELEEFILAMEKGKYRRVMDNRPLAPSTIVTYKDILKKFVLWMNAKKGTKLDVSFVDTYRKDLEIPALTRDEVEKLIDASQYVRDKFIVRVLFDSGARIEEFLNLRWTDMTWDKELKCYLVRIRVSKTKPRTISLPLSTKEIEVYREHLTQQGVSNNNDYVVDMTYDAVRIMLTRLGKAVLKKRVNPHLFRHSSATYYANLLSFFPFCHRYGWTFTSKQPQRYIDRNGIQERETARIVKGDEVTKAKEESGKLKEDVTRLASENKEMWKMLRKLALFVRITSEAGTKSEKVRTALRRATRDLQSRKDLAFLFEEPARA